MTSASMASRSNIKSIKCPIVRDYNLQIIGSISIKICTRFIKIVGTFVVYRCRGVGPKKSYAGSKFDKITAFFVSPREPKNHHFGDKSPLLTTLHKEYFLECVLNFFRALILTTDR